jgi:hypothetical protein
MRACKFKQLRLERSNIRCRFDSRPPLVILPLIGGGPTWVVLNVGPPKYFTIYRSHLLAPFVSCSASLFFLSHPRSAPIIHNRAPILHSPLRHVPFSSSLLSSDTFFSSSRSPILVTYFTPLSITYPHVFFSSPCLLHLALTSKGPQVSSPTFARPLSLFHIRPHGLCSFHLHTKLSNHLCLVIVYSPLRVMCFGHHVGSRIFLLALS